MRTFTHTPPASEPLSLGEAKDHLRVDHGDEDGAIAAAIVAARQWAEERTSRRFVTTVLELELDGRPPEEIKLRQGPIVSVDAITYTDQDGNEQTLDPSRYQVASGDAGGYIAAAYSDSWPDVRSVYGSFRVRYTVGYGGPEAVPEPIRAALKFLVGHFYENREAEKPVPSGVAAMLAPYRIIVL